MLDLPQKRTLKVIQVYAPTKHLKQTASDFDQELERFYSELEAVLSEKSTYTIVQGDFNAKVGKIHDKAEEKFLGKFGIGERNHCGERLITFAASHKMKIMNTFFQKSEKRQWTWRSPDSSAFNQIDYVLCSASRILSDVSVIGEKIIYTGSDHRMLRSTISINLKKERSVLKRQKTLPKKLFNADIFAANLSKEDLSFHEEKGINCDYENFVKQITDNVNRASEASNQQSKRIKDGTIQLMKRRSQLKAEGKTDEAYKKLCDEIRKKVKEDYDDYRKRRLEEAAEMRRSLKAVERDVRLKQHIPEALKDENGIRTINRHEMKNICSRFYTNLYASKTKVQPIVSSDAEMPVPEVLPEEVEAAVKVCRKGKSPGKDNIKPEHLKAGGQLIYKALAERFSYYIEKGKVPDAWRSSKMILLLKKGDPEDLNNYRPITLLSQIYKVFTRVVLNRIQKRLDNELSKEQAGFRSGYSTIDHIHVLKQLMEKCREYQIPLCIGYIDYKKAFDSVETAAVLNALKEFRIEAKYVKIIEEIYRGCYAEIDLFEEPCRIEINKGVRQGDTISPKLFVATLESLFRRIKWKNGIRIDGVNLTHLLFADDCVLFAKSADELRRTMEHLQQESRKIGLEVNAAKTKWMRNDYAKAAHILVEGKEIEEVEEYVYLGHLVNRNQSSQGEINRRKRAGWVAFNRIKTSLLDEDLNMEIRRNLFNSTVLPAMTYAAECWSVTKADEEGLLITERAMERMLCKISRRDHVPNEEIRRRTEVKDVIRTAYDSKRRWAGHVARLSDDRWTSRITTWTPYDQKRPLGRPKTRWADPMTKKYGETWMRRAKDRSEWHEIDLRNWRNSVRETLRTRRQIGYR